MGILFEKENLTKKDKVKKRKFKKMGTTSSRGKYAGKLGLENFRRPLRKDARSCRPVSSGTCVTTFIGVLSDTWVRSVLSFGRCIWSVAVSIAIRLVSVPSNANVISDCY